MSKCIHDTPEFVHWVAICFRENLPFIRAYPTSYCTNFTLCSTKCRHYTSTLDPTLPFNRLPYINCLVNTEKSAREFADFVLHSRIRALTATPSRSRVCLARPAFFPPFPSSVLFSSPSHCTRRPTRLGRRSRRARSLARRPTTAAFTA